MRTVLLTTCAITALSGLMMVQGANAQTQTSPSNKQPSAQSGSTTAPPASTSTKPSQPSAQTSTSAPSADAKQGVRRVDGAAVVMTFYTANAADFRASKLMGKSVYNLNNENIGEVNDLIVNDGKTIKAIVVGVGGFLGMGERNVAIDPASVVLKEQSDGSARLVVNTTKEELKKAPAFNLADVDKETSSTTASGSGNN